LTKFTNLTIPKLIKILTIKRNQNGKEPHIFTKTYIQKEQRQNKTARSDHLQPKLVYWEEHVCNRTACEIEVLLILQRKLLLDDQTYV
jgi:hypothetical protein